MKFTVKINRVNIWVKKFYNNRKFQIITLFTFFLAIFSFLPLGYDPFHIGF